MEKNFFDFDDLYIIDNIKYLAVPTTEQMIEEEKLNQKIIKHSLLFPSVEEEEEKKEVYFFDSNESEKTTTFYNKNENIFFTLNNESRKKNFNFREKTADEKMADQLQYNLSIATDRMEKMESRKKISAFHKSKRAKTNGRPFAFARYLIREKYKKIKSYLLFSPV